MAETRYRIPDVCVFRRDLNKEQVFTQPQMIAIDVLSPEDRHSRMQERIEDFIAFHVQNIWVVDPIKRIGWNCSDGNWACQERLEVKSTPIYLSLNELFQKSMRMNSLELMQGFGTLIKQSEAPPVRRRLTTMPAVIT